MQNRKVVSAYFESQQILPFGFADKYYCLSAELLTRHRYRGSMNFITIGDDGGGGIGGGGLHHHLDKAGSSSGEHQ